MRTRFLVLAGLAAGALSLAAACSDSPITPSAARMPGDPGDARDRLFYQAKLAPLGDAGAIGMALIDVVGGELRVRVHANGLEPNQPIPEHIHLNPGCDPGGGILLDLDAGLTVPGEGPGVGPNYPTANPAGVVNYEATRSLADLRAAFATYQNLTFATDADLLAYLDLENRNVHMHVAFGPPFPAVVCGEVERVN